MPATVSVMYPNVEGATFDLDYYLQSHMPMVMRRFSPYGMRGWRVVKVVGTPSGEAPSFSVVATLEFTDVDAFHAALKADGEAVLADVPHFSNKSPTFLIGDHVGQG